MPVESGVALVNAVPPITGWAAPETTGATTSRSALETNPGSSTGGSSATRSPKPTVLSSARRRETVTR